MRSAAVWTLACAAFALHIYAAAPRMPLGLDLYRPVPENNPLTPRKIALGRELFNDPKLSRNGTRSCASCHDAARAFSGTRTVTSEFNRTVINRNVPALVNRAWGTTFFWDGRAATLEEQVLQPIMNPRELAMTPERVRTLVRSRMYRAQFLAAFDSEPELDHVAQALASYVRTILAGNSPFDRYVAGDRSALSASALRGLRLFNGKAGCNLCHAGPNFTDELFHNTGIAWRTGTLTDEGRARVSRREEDRGAFKTPTLRQVAATAPYMHDGSFASLQQVIDHYDRGGQRAPGLDRRLRVLKLHHAEKRDLVAFLMALTGTVSEGR